MSPIADCVIATFCRSAFGQDDSRSEGRLVTCRALISRPPAVQKLVNVPYISKSASFEPIKTDVDSTFLCLTNNKTLLCD